MNKIFLLTIFLFVKVQVIAQNTWVQKLAYNVQMQGYDDTLVGPKQIEIGRDGSAYVLANIHPHGGQTIYKFAPNSHQLEWSADAGYDFAAGPQWTDRFKATSDSGIITCFNSQYLMEPAYGQVRKYGKDGTLQWITVFQIWDWNSLTDRIAYDVIEYSPGIYDVLVRDSLYTLDQNGVIIDSTGAINGTQFMKMVTGDFLVLTGNNLQRVDTTGNVIWSQPCNGPFAYDTASVFIVNANSFVQKVDALTGVQIWNKDYGFTPISDIEASHTGGFIASVGYKPIGRYDWSIGIPSPGHLVGTDALGDTLWTRTYMLPYKGLSALKSTPSGNLLTGGGYYSGPTPWNYKDGSPFICMMNSDGSFPLAQTDYLSPGDANHDHFSYFVDDALTMMLALGHTGPVRDTSLDEMTSYYGAMACNRSELSIDWSTFSSSGINDKYSDYDGNGLVDTNDINGFSSCLVSYQDSIPLFYRLGHHESSLSTKDFCLVPVHDTIQPGEPALYYMVMGAAGDPVDSIYGFAFSCFMQDWQVMHADSVSYYSTGLGTPGNNLWGSFSFSTESNNFYQTNHILVCRTDFQNAVSVFDTIGMISFSGYFSHSNFAPTISDFKALLVSGTEIPFNVCAGNIYIDSSSVSISEKQNAAISIFPNPATNFLFINNLSPGNKKMSVLNSLGVIVSEYESSEKQIQINVADLPAAIYTIAIQSDNGVKNSFFIVNH